MPPETKSYEEMVTETIHLLNVNRKMLESKIVDMQESIQLQAQQIDILMDLFAKKP